MNTYIFANCAKNPVTRELRKFTENKDVLSYFAAFTLLLDFSRTQGVTEHTVREYCVRMLLDTPRAREHFCDRELTPYIENDIELLYNLYFACDWQDWCVRNDVLPPPRGVAQGMPDDYRFIMEGMVESESAQDLRDRLAAFFRTYSGYMDAVYTAFRWNGKGLEGILHPDAMTFDQLGGLAYQKQSLIMNTQSFLDGKPANDVLLVGGSGTGKSSCVKATLNHFAGDGLRLVEMSKQDIDSLPLLMRVLREKTLHYIIYIDDLSFESADASYMGLKVALDGQVERRPDNVIIYATSNRRHLVKESWQERGGEDEVHATDTRSEKMSLSERFGIHLYFSTLSQPEYFAVVELLLERQNVTFDESIAKSAAAWAATNSGRSGRSAKQFVNQYMAK